MRRHASSLGKMLELRPADAARSGLDLHLADAPPWANSYLKEAILMACILALPALDVVE